MLKYRVITALVLVPIVVALVVWLPSFAFLLAVEVVVLASLWEWQRLCGLDQPAPVAVGYFALAAVLMVAAGVFAFPTASFWLGVAGVVWWCLVALWLTRPALGDGGGAVGRLGKAVAGYLCLIPSWALLGELHAAPRGSAWVLLLLALVWAADICAYFAGRRFGGRRLAPVLSPGKTWAGVWGGVLGAGVVAVVGGWLLGVRGAMLAVLLGLAWVTVGFSLVGDLFESLIKRQAGAKDSSRLLPGHGGALDRLDSLFAAIPVFTLGHAWFLS